MNRSLLGSTKRVAPFFGNAAPNRRSDVIFFHKMSYAMKNIFRNIHVIAGLVGLCIVLNGCDRDTSFIPKSADSIVVYSLESEFDEDKLPSDAEMMHGYYVLGKTKMSGDSAQQVLNSVRNDIAGGTSIAACFDPHHALRIDTGKGVLDIVICYKCKGFKKGSQQKLNGSSYPIAVSSRQLLNNLLKSADVELSAQAIAPLK